MTYSRILEGVNGGREYCQYVGTRKWMSQQNLALVLSTELRAYNHISLAALARLGGIS